MAPTKTPGAIETNLENDVSILAGFSQRVINSIRGAVAGWFGPYEPIPPVAPAGTPVRLVDYPVGYNINISPRSGEPVSFAQLRSLADSHDITRLAIETRKDQVSKMPWGFRLKEQPDKSRKEMKEASQNDERIQQLTQFFSYPDREHTFAEWVRLLMEDLLVIDAPVVYPRMTKGKEVYSLDVIDGSTICRKIDTQARTPMPPDVAYQQVIKGMPTVDLTADDIVYKPRNIRAHKIYGFSPVEQIVITVNTALRRQLQQLFHFTDGNTPESLFMVDGDWTPDQIEQFQKAFDSYMSLQNRSKMKFGPKGQYVDLKPWDAKTDLDEWLARIVCYCFNLPPNAFVKQQNRATAQNASETALQEGLFPILQWLSDLLNFILAKYWKFEDVEFYWGDQRDEDPAQQAETAALLFKTGILTLNQSLARIGEDPVDESDEPLANRHGIVTATGFAPLDEPQQPNSAEGDAGSQPTGKEKAPQSSSADKFLDYRKKKVSRPLLQ